MLSALLGGQHEHPVTTTLEIKPGKVDFRVQRLDVNLAVAHFNNQQAFFGQMVSRLGQHPAYQVQTIIAASQAQLRFMLVLGRHVGEIFSIDIRRVGHDQVEALPRQTIKAIEVPVYLVLSQADILGTQVERPQMRETTALGAST